MRDLNFAGHLPEQIDLPKLPEIKNTRNDDLKLKFIKRVES